MSLHKFAEQVASQGRGDDSLLVHMTPDEVRNLQQFAEANGTTLTINPTTGLPEAGLLSDLFKAVAPIALGAFLGPGAFGIAGLGLSAGTAGLVTGGLTTLATGSLSRGLMAGLGAYGGAGLAEGLAGTGAGVLGQQASEATAMELANAGASEGLTGEAYNKAFQQSVTDKMAGANTFSAGLNAAKADPLGFAKNNLSNIGMAAAPIMAGAMVPTTTKLPDPKDTGRIRQMAFNINPDTGRPDPLYGMREMAPIKASEFGNKTFQGQRNLFYQQNPNPYELGVGSLNQPPQQAIPMAGGGIVALAGGGDYTTLTKDSSAEDIASAYKQFTTASGGDTAANQKAAVDYLTNLGIGQDKIGQAYGTYQASPTYAAYTPEQIGSYFQTNPNADIAADITKFNANPADVNRYISNIAAPFVGSTDTTGGSGTLGIYNQMNALGIDPNELYASRIAADPKYAGWSQADITRGYNLDKGALALAAADKDGVSDKEWVNFMDTNGYSVNDMAQAFGLSKNEVQRRYDAAKKVDKVVTPITTVTGLGTGTGTAGTGINTVKPDAFTSVVPSGFYGNATNPGDITRNPDGTATVHPNIPYRPYGGFSGIEEVSNAYTKGGGSLGYKAAVPKTAAEHNALYNKQTDDSLDAYNYLMGKGKNLTQRKPTADRPVMQRYDEAILGRKIAKPTKTTTTTTTVKGTPGNPQSYFDEKAYLAANPDVAEELRTGKSVTGQPTRFTSGYEHYLMYGKAGGRPFTGDYEGYTTAAALANAAGAGGGGEGPAGPSSNTGNTISGFNPAAPNPSIAESFGNAPASTDGNTGSTTGTEGGAVASARGGLLPRGYALGGGLGSLGSYSDGGRLLKGPGDGVSDSIPATIGQKQQPARLADGEFVVPARIVSELGNGSTDAGAKKLYAMMDRVQRARGKTTGKNKVAANSRSDKYLPA
jgi:hypothetical protein